jgi:hypothetical protein
MILKKSFSTLGRDGALAHRKEYDTVTSTKLVSHKRYEYDGLKLLRVDERCDADGDGEVEAVETSRRTLEAAIESSLPWWEGSREGEKLSANSFHPHPASPVEGEEKNLLAKRVYSYPTEGDRCTSDGSTDYYYAYDHVGNVYAVFDDDGAEVYRFARDAVGNELDFGNSTGYSWASAA